MEKFQEGLQMYLKRTSLQMFPKVAGKFKKKLEEFTKIQIFFIRFFMPMSRLSNGCSVLLL